MLGNCYIATIRNVKSIHFKERKDFGDGCHSASTEPYFYEAAYQPVQRDSPIPVNRQGQCVVALSFLRVGNGRLGSAPKVVGLSLIVK